MKSGTLIIEQRDGQWGAWVKRADGEEILLEGFPNPEQLKHKNGAVCQYLKKKNQLVVRLENKEIFNQSSLSRQEYNPPSGKPPKISGAQALCQSERENPVLEIPEPDLTELRPCHKPKKLRGENLFDQNPGALRIPLETKGVLQKLKNKKIDNFNLALNKTVHFFHLGRKGNPEYDHLSDGKAEAFLFRSTFDDRSGGKQNKISRKFEIEFSFAAPSPKKSLESLLNRQNHLLATQKKNGWEVKSNRLEVDNRLIAGLGGASVFETSMTLHHIYGIPYLPGSSIKGLVRSWIIFNCFLQGQNGKNKGKEAEKTAMKNPLFAHIFGTDTDGPENKAHRGKIVFFDAYPQSPPVIEADVMNVHYPKYYSQGKVPADYDSPNPIPFLTVGKCDAEERPLEFSFALAARENPVVTDESLNAGIEKICKKEGLWREGLSANSTVLDVAHHWLHSALTHHGIGAKTAVGYGYFRAGRE